MFKSVLLPLDRSVLAECVLPHAVAIATALDARVTLFHAMHSPAGRGGGGRVDPLEWRVQQAEPRPICRASGSGSRPRA